MKCSKCGNTEHFYKYTPVRGKIATYYRGDGTYDGISGVNMDMYETLHHGKEQKTARCALCHKILTKKELEAKSFEDEVNFTSRRNDSIDDEDESSTCYDCVDKHECPYAFDPYNTDGDCLALK